MPVIEIECGVLGQAGTLISKRLAHIVTSSKPWLPSRTFKHTFTDQNVQFG